jgi:gluconokinase
MGVMAESALVLVMGVAGSGKTTIGRALADRLGWLFCDADDFHPPENVAKMSRGEPLDDADRAPWLAAVSDRVERERALGRSVVLACSALKPAYRQRLGVGQPNVFVVHLRGSSELIGQRLRARTGHFAKEQLLASQFDALEPPLDAIDVSAADTPDQVLAQVLERLQPLLPGPR